jgi:hypothetical protein
MEITLTHGLTALRENRHLLTPSPGPGSRFLRSSKRYNNREPTYVCQQGPGTQAIGCAQTAAQAASQTILLFLALVLKLNPSPPKLMVTRKPNDSHTLISSVGTFVNILNLVSSLRLRLECDFFQVKWEYSGGNYYDGQKHSGASTEILDRDI